MKNKAGKIIATAAGSIAAAGGLFYLFVLVTAWL